MFKIYDEYLHNWERIKSFKKMIPADFPIMVNIKQNVTKNVSVLKLQVKKEALLKNNYCKTNGTKYFNSLSPMRQFSLYFYFTIFQLITLIIIVKCWVIETLKKHIGRAAKEEF